MRAGRTVAMVLCPSPVGQVQQVSGTGARQQWDGGWPLEGSHSVGAGQSQEMREMAAGWRPASRRPSRRTHSASGFGGPAFHPCPSNAV